MQGDPTEDGIRNFLFNAHGFLPDDDADLAKLEELLKQYVDKRKAELASGTDAPDAAHSPGGEPEQAKPAGSNQKKATVNERMAGKIMKSTEAMGWNSRQWAEHLKCVKSSVVETATWKMLESARLQQKAERMNDRRRKPKVSDSRRD